SSILGFPSVVRQSRERESQPVLLPSGTRRASPLTNWRRTMAASGTTSKKRSDASLPSPPEQLVFFVDRSLGRKIIPTALRKTGEEVRVHDEHFPQDTRDGMAWGCGESRLGRANQRQ